MSGCYNKLWDMRAIRIQEGKNQIGRPEMTTATKSSSRLAKELLFVITDTILINLAWIFSYMLIYDDFSLSNAFAFIGGGKQKYLFLGIFTVAALLIHFAFGLYRSIWQYAGMWELFRGIASALFDSGLFILLLGLSFNRPTPVRPAFLVFLFFLIAFVLLVSRFSYRGLRLIKDHWQMRGVKKVRVMLIGAGSASETVIRELQDKKSVRNIVPVCIIDDDRAKRGTTLHSVPVVGDRDSIIENAKRRRIDEIWLSIPSATRKEQAAILDICKQTGCVLKIIPGLDSILKGSAHINNLRKVEVEDLLGRDPIKFDMDNVSAYINNKVVLVTGGGGSIGSELCRQIAGFGPKQLIIFDVYENNAYDIRNELRTRFPDLDLVTLIGSVRDHKRVEAIFELYRPQIVFHAAAHKHVPLMEDSPNEAIKNNVFGTFKVAKAADMYNTEKFVLISTDKAVNPTNIMGASKRLCEMVVQYFNDRSKTEYVAVRFGNVLGSNGSVIPLFKKQIADGGPVTVTDKRIIRYFMTIPEAVSLVLEAGTYAKGGEIFVLDMGKPVKILDLAENLIRLSGYTPYKDIEIKFAGLRPGEKLYEELLIDTVNLKKTANDLIYVDDPPPLAPDFREKIDHLYNVMLDDSVDMRALIRDLVPTYISPEESKKAYEEAHCIFSCPDGEKIKTEAN